MQRKPSGSVTVCTLRGRLRIRLPRNLFEIQTYLTLSLTDSPLNRQIAEMKAKQIELDIALGVFDRTLDKYRTGNEASSHRMDELWQQYCEARKKELSHATIVKDLKVAGNHIKKLPTQRLDRAREIRNYLVRTLSGEAARRCLMQLNACCSWAVDEGLLTINPFEKLRSPKKKTSRNINPFTPGEITKILKGFEQSELYSSYLPFIKFLFYTGCRPSEAIALQWQHISPDLKSITFSESVVYGQRKKTKTCSTRRFPINKSLKLLLKSISGDFDHQQLVFPAQKGGVIDTHNLLTRAWKPILKQQGINHRPLYNTRHTFITNCLEQGVPVVQVAEWAGNSPDVIWSHYAGLVSNLEVPELF